MGSLAKDDGDELPETSEFISGEIPMGGVQNGFIAKEILKGGAVAYEVSQLGGWEMWGGEKKRRSEVWETMYR